ncbi:putative hydrolase (metallo-beta-lactamase superfamily) [Methanomethylovorans hollandica DSM 15978]|uniref:Putative hydrolase (Metallo-beta-lactamase superfamily) n=2 Tax=Methanomethylovorans hollandica TaxID=101192 RepID=L0L077_METHD|nr:putative hydrolase (metallo-beta-lactamase superfamily) [Methanomethylovorans hollandica DSM 15978]
MLGVLLGEPKERPPGSAVQPPNNTTTGLDENAFVDQDALHEQVSSDTQIDNLTIHFIDVGQGDSILVECANATMLIDAGGRDKGASVSVFLRELRISSLDYVVATHPHEDNIGGLLTILNEYPVGNFVDSGYPHTTQIYEEMLGIIENKSISFQVAERGKALDFAPGIQVQVLNPQKQHSKEINENSIVLRIIDNNVSFLLMGDAGLETEDSIIYEGYYVDSDILKVGHHASTDASGASFIEEVSPGISIISVGTDNDYGYPHAEILERLQNVSTIYRTDHHGTITVTTDGLTWEVITERNPTDQDSMKDGTSSHFPVIKVRE